MKVDITKSYTVGSFAFLWAIIFGLLLQLFVLPHIFPNLHAGNGLLKGADWVWFNQVATELAVKIQENGWGVWELRPYGQAPAGMAAAIYAATGISEPFVYLPLNALLFAIAVAELHRLISYLIDDPNYAWIGVLPIIIFPSSLMVYGQLHKDVFSMAGILIILNTLLLNSIQRGGVSIFPFIMRTIIGLFLIWVVRPYFMDVIIAAWRIGVGLLLLWLLWYRPKQMKWSLLVIITILVIHQYALQLNLNYRNVGVVERIQYQQQQQQQQQQVEFTRIPIQGSANTYGSLPARFDRVRQNFINSYPNAGSMLDGDVRFYSITDIFTYLPRAIQVGYLAPFPNMWFETGVNVGAGIMRKISGIEMLITYIALFAGIMTWIIKWRSKYTLIFLAVVVTGSALLVIQTIAIPNIGTLYRMRLAPWHLTLGLNLAIAFKVFIESRKK